MRKQLDVMTGVPEEGSEGAGRQAQGGIVQHAMKGLCSQIGPVVRRAGNVARSEVVQWPSKGFWTARGDIAGHTDKVGKQGVQARQATSSHHLPTLDTQPPPLRAPVGEGVHSGQGWVVRAIVIYNGWDLPRPKARGSKG